MIYYIYKVRRKQTSIRFSRSVLPHRYLRCISWISWNGHRPPQAGFFHASRRSCARDVFGGAYTQGRDSYAPTSTPPGGQANTPPIFPQNNPLPFSRTPLACRSSCVALPAALPTIHPRPVHRLPPHRFCGLPTNKKNAGPRHCAANPLTKKA